MFLWWLMRVGRSGFTSPLAFAAIRWISDMPTTGVPMGWLPSVLGNALGRAACAGCAPRPAAAVAYAGFCARSVFSRARARSPAWSRSNLFWTAATSAGERGRAFSAHPLPQQRRLPLPPQQRHLPLGRHLMQRA